MKEIDGKIYLRPSGINEYLECGAKSYFHYVKEVHAPNKWHLAFGKSIHHGLYINFDQKIITKRDLPADSVKDAFGDSFEKEFQEVEKSDLNGSVGLIKDDGYLLLDMYMKDIAPRMLPVYAEKTIKMDIKDHPYGIIMTVDLFDAYNVITDYKTTSKGIKEDYEPYKKQVGGFYSWGIQALGLNVEQTHIHWLSRGNNISVNVRSVPIDIEYAKKTFLQVSRAIQNDVFMPNRNSIYCRKKYCKYWMACEKKYGGTVKN